MALSKGLLERDSEFSLLDPSQIYKGLAQVGEGQEIESMKEKISTMQNKLEKVNEELGRLRVEATTKENEAKSWKEKSKKQELEILNLRSGFAEQDV